MEKAKDRRDRYIRTHLEPTNRRNFGWEDGAGLLVKLEIPLQRYVDISREGSLQLQAGNIEYAMGYESLAANSTASDSVEAIRPNISHTFRKLTSLVVRNTSTGQMLDVVSLLPKEYDIIFKTYVSDYDPGGETDRKNKVISMNGNITEPSWLVVLLHEIGHTNDRFYDTQSFEEVSSAYGALNRQRGELRPNMQEIILRGERNAWAFALKVLKPLLEGQTASELFTMARVRDYLYTRCLSEYSYQIREKRKLQAKRIVTEV